ncbi:DsbC/DsbD-like thiol-disulfide interchange protein/cytochrome c biogenesis protein CcdA [Altererythrobacter atlanticus]|uniref:Thiol:disulfide interchange protein DsbD n=1 Tax=Croceibacterium atlanticum TaxID=1267766 RepID=A0A0F7KYF2_9SPHN|nr:protein-disulfide reductase DsbD domain-containing protein [Croceibacterium atlanticum]AKH44257.1 Thiol:disulfide interchange protein DsbD precursor [Croceibacterium atlanticum]MBB5732568.1 DsbC/DsbD-like thiol-disulfide interchange protein/cytochrome c biogenesis protein CcdA [Croceibacterium atlanticum]
MRASTINCCRWLIVLLAAMAAQVAMAQLPPPQPAKGNNIASELVAEGGAQAGEMLTVALHFRPEPGWHGYWSNPGDAGYGMELDWNLPEGWEAGEPDYPVPETLVISNLMNHVYEGDYAVLVPISVPADAQLSGPVPIELKADWLACTDQICVPESATMSLRLPVGADVPRDPRFDQWRAALPPMLDSEAAFELTGDALRIAIPLPASLDLAEPHVFVGETQLVDYAAPQIFMRDGDLLVAEIPREGLADGAGRIPGILKLDNLGGGLRFSAMPGEVPAGGTPVGGTAQALAPIWLLLGGAFIGGLILNLMPCVFPILSLKALTLARAGESAEGARREGLAYTAGVVLACLALGGLLLALRAAGSEIGWAFQLQEPGVVVALLVLAVLITANFAGLYELPSFSFTREGGRASAFSTGLLAAFVATPCTGPFMAAALGAALLLPWWQALILFAAMGLGLALPFLLLGFVPPLRRLLPKPGRWMEWFRKIMAVPMGLTALALLWLCWRLGGWQFAALAGVLALVLTGALAWGLREGNRGRPGRFVLPSIAGLALAISVVLLPMVHAPPGNSEQSLLSPRNFSDAVLADARAEKRPVFLWFTADWCLTCKVNENVAIERETTRKAFERAGVIAIRGDWTRRDPEITRFLTAQGAAGVPLYLWYPAGGEGEVLPQVLTPDMLAELAAAE